MGKEDSVETVKMKGKEKQDSGERFLKGIVEPLKYGSG